MDTNQPGKKKFGRAASRMEGLEGAAGWRKCAVRQGPVRGELAGCISSPSTPGSRTQTRLGLAGGGGGACGGEGECVARASGGESGSHRGEAHRRV